MMARSRVSHRVTLISASMLTFYCLSLVGIEYSEHRRPLLFAMLDQGNCSVGTLSICTAAGSEELTGSLGLSIRSITILRPNTNRLHQKLECNTLSLLNLQLIFLLHPRPTAPRAQPMVRCIKPQHHILRALQLRWVRRLLQIRRRVMQSREIETRRLPNVIIFVEPVALFLLAARTMKQTPLVVSVSFDFA